MKNWKDFFSEVIRTGADVSALKANGGTVFEQYRVYPDSIQKVGSSYFYLARDQAEKFLVVTGDAAERYPFQGEMMEIGGLKVKKCPMSNENCTIIRELFDFTNPTSNRNGYISVGFGDRLGVASPGHIRLIKNLPIYPVLAQQSIRELNLTGRTFADVVSAAAWAVFQEGYTKGYGADGDHLKSRVEVKTALENSCTMITLDCSEYIRNDIDNASPSLIRSEYSKIESTERLRWESDYFGKTFSLVDGTKLKFTSENFYKIVLIYIGAIRFTKEIYRDYISLNKEPVDFELSIDETATPTSPEAHFFIAQELKSSGVKLSSLAPRFCGQFQKGIDYKGDLSRFEEEYKIHQEIANMFGYKLSIHSGSDKLSVFPCIGRYSRRFHLKTAGTNWLEAVRLISEKNPALFREMYRFAFEHFHEATKYYCVTTDLTKVPDINGRKDNELPQLLNLDDTRQMLHITYGLILQAKNPDGTDRFRSELYKTLFIYEQDYYGLLEEHLGKHLKKLGLLPG